MFEIHVTVLSNEVEQFKKDCAEFGCKPLLIELQHNSGSYQQLMTSQNFKHKEWDIEIQNIKEKLETKKYLIKRIKVEINPYAYNNVPIKYYETHFRIKSNNQNESLLDDITRNFGFHKSKNVFKNIDNIFYYQMATYRTYDLDIKKFENIIETFKEKLKENSLVFDKVEVESCIIDTNDSLDKKWLENSCVLP